MPPQAPGLASQQLRAKRKGRGQPVTVNRCQIRHKTRVTSRYNTQRVRHKPERYRFGFAEVLAVDVVRDRAVCLEGELIERGGADHIPPGGQFVDSDCIMCESAASVVSVRIRRSANRSSPELKSVWGRAHRVAAQVGPRRAVRDDAHEQAANRRLARDAQLQGGAAAVVPVVPADGGPQVGARRGAPPAGPLPLHVGDDLRVDPQAALKVK